MASSFAHLLRCQSEFGLDSIVTVQNRDRCDCSDPESARFGSFSRFSASASPLRSVRLIAVPSRTGADLSVHVELFTKLMSCDSACTLRPVSVPSFPNFHRVPIAKGPACRSDTDYPQSDFGIRETDTAVPCSGVPITIHRQPVVGSRKRAPTRVSLHHFLTERHVAIELSWPGSRPDFVVSVRCPGSWRSVVPLPF